ncbi:hypothetical protein K466DRAFT_562026 [Polyporus arcularius HHB13444]|uniref:Uncharacterized protein n=1 Tax=Polyporus arcularius HHB13444 TaxID=1314778 RepID=A0A5C3PTU0_9APHY|nr:hypothetical protein K466DRAFT_562026 [Polyporus arcularius HHB13444]
MASITPAPTQNPVRSQTLTPPLGNVLVFATPEEGEIVEHTQPRGHEGQAARAANASFASTTSLPSVVSSLNCPPTPMRKLMRSQVPETPLATQLNTGRQTDWYESLSPTRSALRARRAQRRDRSAPYPSALTIRNSAVFPENAVNATRIQALPADTSEDMWAQLGSTPIVEASVGSVLPAEENTGPVATADNRAREQLPTTAAAFSLRTIYEANEGDEQASVVAEVPTVDELAGEYSPSPPHARIIPNSSKRAWRGSPSPTIEHRIRGRNKRARAALPSEPDLEQGMSAELHGNPWALSSEEEGEDGNSATRLDRPLATSTPVLRSEPPSRLHAVQSDDDFFLDNVNTSGRPPTPHNMQNSSFLERLRRSAGANDFRVKSIYYRPDTDPHSHDHVPRTTMGRSSPLPPSSPIPSESPSRPISERDVQSLLKRNQDRFDSLLGRQESSRIQTAPRTRHDLEERPHASRSHPSTRSNARDHEHAAQGHIDRSTRRERPQNTREDAQDADVSKNGYIPLPNTRAAIYLQEQIEARAAEWTRTGPASRKPHASEASTEAAAPSPSDLRRQQQSRASTRSAMDVSSRRSPTQEPTREEGRERTALSRNRWMDTVLGSTRDTSPTPGPGRAKNPSSPMPPPLDPTTMSHNAIPTALTATAPEVDRPMTTDHRLTARVHRDDPEALIRGTSQRWIGAVWADDPNTSVLVEVFNFQFTDNIQANRIMVETLRQVTYLITGEKQVSIVPPDLDDRNLRRLRDAPRVWAIRGLSPAGEEAMLSRFPWSFRAISFFTYKRTVTPDTWIMALDGFFDENHLAIASAIREVLEEDEHWKLLATLTRDHPELRSLPRGERVNAILDSIVIQTWRLSNQNVVANVHIRPPTYDIPKWREWAAKLRGRTYGNFINGTGIVRRISNCLGCNSVDHPAHLCTFHDLPGWKGPRAGAGTYSPLVTAAPMMNGPPPPRNNSHFRGGGPARGGMRTPTRRRGRGGAPGQTRN